MTRIAVLVLASVSVVAAQAPSQSPSALNTRFDVVTVKRNTSGDPGGSFGCQTNGRCIGTNIPALFLVLSAYDVQQFQVVGAPGWFESEQYDISATTAGGFRSRDQQIAMLRSLLADQFKFLAHRETRPVPGFALVRARPDGTLGPQLTRSTADCAALRASGQLAKMPPPQSLEDLQTPRTCSFIGGNGMFVAGGTAIDNLTQSLVRSVNAPVANNTGLTGEWIIVLRWNPDPIPKTPGAPVPSLESALQQQLGLTLERQQQSVDMLVIDRIEMPAAN